MNEAEVSSSGTVLVKNPIHANPVSIYANKYTTEQWFKIPLRAGSADVGSN